jgi:hypothetical protein
MVADCEKSQFLTTHKRRSLEAGPSMAEKKGSRGFPFCDEAFQRLAGLGRESMDLTLAYLKGKDAESEEAREHANSCAVRVRPPEKSRLTWQHG